MDKSRKYQLFHQKHAVAVVSSSEEKYCKLIKCLFIKSCTNTQNKTPELVVTCIRQCPCLHCHTKILLNFNLILLKVICRRIKHVKEPLALNSHFLGVPWLAYLIWFDCITNYVKMHTFLLPFRIRSIVQVYAC